MTLSDLERGNELKEQMNELQDNIYLLEYALKEHPRYGKLKRFFFESIGKNKIHIGSQCISFGGFLKVDRESMELLKKHFENKFEETKSELAYIGKGGVQE